MTIKFIKNENFARCKEQTDNYKNVKYAFCTNHNGKMSNVISISTSPFVNPICRKRSMDVNSICHYCFARALANAKKNLEKKLAKNTAFLTETKLNTNDVPIINYNKYRFLRFEAFGDLMTTTQVYNYFLIASVNKNMRCALWTKNPQFIAKAMTEYGITKPSNMTIIYSSSKVNEPAKIPYGFIDKVFTVYEKKYAKEHGIKINCGARDCNKCGRCYSRRTSEIVNELLK